jgi:hypothetical protein
MADRENWNNLTQSNFLGFRLVRFNDGVFNPQHMAKIGFHDHLMVYRLPGQLHVSFGRPRTRPSARPPRT